MTERPQAGRPPAGDYTRFTVPPRPHRDGRGGLPGRSAADI